MKIQDKFSILILDLIVLPRCLMTTCFKKSPGILVISILKNLEWTTIKTLEVVECQDLKLDKLTLKKIQWDPVLDSPI
jgi:hypothetical protein